MPVETGIYNALLQRPKSVAEYDAEAMQGRQNQLAMQMDRAKLAEYQRGIADEQQMRGVVGSFGADKAANYNKLLGAGRLKEAQAYEKSNAEIYKEQRAAEKEHLANVRDRWALLNNAIAGSTDQSSYTMNRQALAAQGVDVSQIPEQFDQGYLANAKQQALTEVQRAEQQWKAKGFDLDERKFGETVRNNKEQIATTRRGQDVSANSAAAGRAQSERHFNVTQSAGKVPTGYRANPDGSLSPIKGGPADPEANGGKMTEDQGKATGWLVQAENAYKNMMAVGRDANGNPTSAAKPGLNDAIGALPGLGGLANTLRGADRQKFIQATSSLSESLLRAATGAGVNKDEAAQKIQELTPLFGEDPEVTRQKYDAIPLYIESLKVRAGPGAKKAAGVIGSAKAATSGAFEDAEKERRYQQWKAKQGQQ